MERSVRVWVVIVWGGDFIYLEFEILGLVGRRSFFIRFGVCVVI